ncbi:hypothetical protein BDK51DRAFT_49570 [Blyttiomyces helicus]|uniref:Uncharacterized protein n=1 Tax=Blyttiomyces helicus TaxID=388810 RepID=A0A4P9VU96_9FUNG|nr:hypothetical protein BDK51DRAFT_49570 [Blyttiomyces helicus]|eukprot:RKO83151.1 hypothetical protein BDK51DRAFT_49570 [Blyttiomyces helicus]
MCPTSFEMFEVESLRPPYFVTFAVGVCSPQRCASIAHPLLPLLRSPSPPRSAETLSRAITIARMAVITFLCLIWGIHLPACAAAAVLICVAAYTYIGTTGYLTWGMWLARWMEAYPNSPKQALYATIPFILTVDWIAF